jgi:DNA-binding transcriptional MerR regulator
MATKTMAKKSAPGAARQKKQVLPDVPDKLYYRIGEVARLCGVETYVLRFWETEFPQLKPHKSGAGQRLYRRREVDLARRIRHLLYEEGYTIPGARQAIQTETRKPSENGQMQLAEAGLKSRDQAPRLKRVRAELKEILGMLSPSPTVRPRLESTRGDRKGEAEIKELFD